MTEKSQQQENVARRRQNAEQMYGASANKAESTRRQKRNASARVNEYKQRKHLQFNQDYNDRKAQEEVECKNLEREVMEMELLEMELIKKLQNTQAVQKQTFEELEKVIRS